ncbi:hypothetical protein FHY33_002946 [Xanthomonas arboricola]|nr:hypothetical protein [Xanthomonas campestris]
MSHLLAGDMRRTVFAPRLQALVDAYIGQDVFRLEPDTMGVAWRGRR